MNEALALGERIGIRWKRAKFTVAQFRQGLNSELEHGRLHPKTDVTHDSPTATAKIAWAHLNEMPDYYTRLERMERTAKSKRDRTMKKKRTTMSDIRYAAKNAGSSYFDRGNSRFFGGDKFAGPYEGPGGLFFVNSNNAGHMIKKVTLEPRFDIRTVERASSHADAREIAKEHARGTRSSERDTRHSYVTDSQLHALEREARMVGDMAMARIAASALRGNHRARREAARVIHEAAARDASRHRRSGAPTFRQQRMISAKIRTLREEGYPAAQAAAIAYRMAGVPLRRKRSSA